MPMQRRILPIAIGGLIVASISATRFVAASHAHPAAAAPAPCTLLTAAEASTALGVSSRPGKEYIGPTGCVWSNDPDVSDSSRRVVLVTHSLLSFNVAKKPAITTIRVEPVSGIGDEAFYQIYPNGRNVFIWTRKGSSTISINIITRRDPRPFTDDEEKAKVAVLAKAAVGRM